MKSTKKNNCRHCGKDFTRACVISFICFECKQKGHIDDMFSNADCPVCNPPTSGGEHDLKLKFPLKKAA